MALIEPDFECIARIRADNEIGGPGVRQSPVTIQRHANDSGEN